MFAKTIASKWTAGRVVQGCVLLAALALSGSSTLAQEERFGNMKEAMSALARNIESVLAEQGLQTVAVRNFDGPAGTSASARIAQALTDQLTGNEKIKVTNGAGTWSVTGEYSADMNKGSGKLEVYIESTLKNQRGRVQSKLLTPIITNQEETLTMFGVSATLPTTVTPAQAAENKTVEQVRTEAVVSAIDKPQIAVDGPAVKTAADSPFAIEILVNGVPVPAVNENGLAFVNVPKEQIYAIRLINKSPEEVGVILTIDGINCLAFSQNPDFKAVGKWVIAPNGTGTIKGWHIQGTEAKSFKVMDYGQSAAAQFASTKDIGTITAVFCACFTGDPPPGTPLGAKGDLATGMGPAVEQRLTAVPRKFGAAKASISVRYTKPDLSDLPPTEPVLAK